MEKLKYILVVLFLAFIGEPILAQSKLPGIVNSGMYYQGTVGIISQYRPLQHVPDAIYSVGAYPLNTPELSPVNGKDVVQFYCRFCHSATYITMQPPLPTATWKAEVLKMINVYGAPIPEDIESQIVEYLQSNYTPETRK
ncbi:MAG TPA: sulfide dehydrogenase [Candidatus Brocadiaceae bacterium]